jgi:hypothetical protein
MKIKILIPIEVPVDLDEWGNTDYRDELSVYMYLKLEQGVKEFKRSIEP